MLSSGYCDIYLKRISIATVPGFITGGSQGQILNLNCGNALPVFLSVAPCAKKIACPFAVVKCDTENCCQTLRLKVAFHAFMAGNKTQALIKAMGIGTGFIGGELHQRRAKVAGNIDGA